MRFLASLVIFLIAVRMFFRGKHAIRPILAAFFAFFSPWGAALILLSTLLLK